MLAAELWVPDDSGALGDVVLGFDRLDGFASLTNPAINMVIGREGPIGKWRL